MAKAVIINFKGIGNEKDAYQIFSKHDCGIRFIENTTYYRTRKTAERVLKKLGFTEIEYKEA